MKPNQLRNQYGEFCTLEQFCDEEPQAILTLPSNLKEQAEYLNEIPNPFKELGKLRQLAEIISAYDLQRNNDTTIYGDAGIKILADGTYCCTSISNNINKVISKAEKIISDCQYAAKKWQSTSYTV